MSEALNAAPAADSNPSGEAAALDSTLLSATPAAGEAKPEEPAKPETSEDKKPEADAFQFDALKLPEGIEIPDEAKAGFTGLVNEYKIPAEAAQKLMDLYASQAKGSADAAVTAWKTMNDQWQSQIKTDLGDKFEPTLQSIGKLVNDPELTDPGFKEAMNLTGAGNNPAVIKTLAKWAARMTEGGYVAGAPASRGPSRPASLGEALYGRGET